MSDETYDLNDDVNNVLGPVTLSPGLLDRWDQEKNQRFYAEQELTPLESTSPSLDAAPIRQSIGERASDPTFNNVGEGEKAADQVRRGQLRADFAHEQLNTPSYKWGYISPSGLHYKCNEFVYDAHASGDPLGGNFPTVLRDNHFYKPTVDNLADPSFAPESLEFHSDVSTARPGDIMVWYGDGHHHSAIATGDGKVAYASTWGAKENSIENINNAFPGVTPIIRRFK